jgi:GNAT superfamily N-acetyltransferase
LSASLRVTPASPADYDVFVRLFPELAIPDPVPTAERFAEGIAPQAIFAREGDRALGYAWARPRGERLHVVHVITAPNARRRGVGRALMDALAERGRAAGFRRWMLNVKPENGAARALYERCGMRVVLESASLRLAWMDLARLPRGDAETSPIRPEEDEAFEDALGLSRGDLSACRATPGRVFYGARGAGTLLGCVAFDPHHPGAPVLRARAPKYARALIESLRAHALPEHDGFFVFVEGEPGLEAALVDAGADVVMRVLRMEGSIVGAGPT